MTPFILILHIACSMYCSPNKTSTVVIATYNNKLACIMALSNALEKFKDTEWRIVGFCSSKE